MNRPGDHEVYEGEDAAIASAFKKSIGVIFALLAMVSIVGVGYFLWPKPEVEEQVGELLIISTRPKSASALVTRAVVELRRGDRVLMQRNY